MDAHEFVENVVASIYERYDMSKVESKEAGTEESEQESEEEK